VLLSLVGLTLSTVKIGQWNFSKISWNIRNCQD